MPKEKSNKIKFIYKIIIIIAAIIKIFTFCYDIKHKEDKRILIRNNYYSFHHYNVEKVSFDKNQCSHEANGKTKRKILQEK